MTTRDIRKYFNRLLKPLKPAIPVNLIVGWEEDENANAGFFYDHYSPDGCVTLSQEAISDGEEVVKLSLIHELVHLGMVDTLRAFMHHVEKTDDVEYYSNVMERDTERLARWIYRLTEGTV